MPTKGAKVEHPGSRISRHNADRHQVIERRLTMAFSRVLYTRSGRKQLPRLFPLALVISAVTLAGSASATDEAQVPQEAGARHIKIRRPSDHPIAVKQIRNLQGPHFLRGVEIDIQNVSNKPVYYVCLYFRFPDV